MLQFDQILNRKGTNCAKWERQGGDFLPMWVADMDFKVPGPLLEAEQNSITLCSAGKIANIPGLPLAYAIIPNPELRKHFEAEALGLFSVRNILAETALTAAYNGSCNAWKKELRDHVFPERSRCPSQRWKNLRAGWVCAPEFWLSLQPVKRSVRQDRSSGAVTVHG